MRRLLSIIPVFALLLVAAACSEAGDVDLVTDAAGYSVGLTDPGEDPEVILRVASEVGATQSVRMVVEQSQEMSADGVDQNLDQTQTMDITYTVAESDGEVLSVETRYDDMTIESATPMPPELEQALRDIFVGQTATTEITDRGSIVSLEFPDTGFDTDIPGVPTEMINQLFDQMFTSIEEGAASMSLPTPVDPVGVGATWDASTEATMLDIPMQLDTTVTVTEITDDAVVADIDQTTSFEESEVELFGISVDLEEGEMTGTGTITYLRDGGIMPLIDMITAGTMSMSARGTTVDQSIEMRQRTSEI